MTTTPSRIAGFAPNPGATLAFALTSALLVVLAHAIAYLAHEYAHSIVAWALGWMADPFALDYGPATLNNILFLGDVGDNVPYDAIFAQGRGLQAAVIALAGMTIGNVAAYVLLARLATRPWIAGHPMRLSIVFWLALMSAGNVWSYVPVRALATHADIALAAKGFGVAPWLQLPFLLVPSLGVILHFFGRMCGPVIAGIARATPGRAVVLIALTGYWFFVFFVGDAAGGSYGMPAELIAITSKYLLFPLSTAWLWHRYATCLAAPHTSR
ncbi:hypothetical protein ACU5AX_04975 [Sphingomonas sp. XXL09]|uniref:hypothetical protein n=1 Tax=Sphingomonas sp. XXL09 TaxID=3457787 RepID=UPI00406BB34A